MESQYIKVREIVGGNVQQAMRILLNQFTEDMIDGNIKLKMKPDQFGEYSGECIFKLSMSSNGIDRFLNLIVKEM